MRRTRQGQQRGASTEQAQSHPQVERNAYASRALLLVELQLGVNTP